MGQVAVERRLQNFCRRTLQCLLTNSSFIRWPRIYTRYASTGAEESLRQKEESMPLLWQSMHTTENWRLELLTARILCNDNFSHMTLTCCHYDIIYLFSSFESFEFFLALLLSCSVSECWTLNCGLKWFLQIMDTEFRVMPYNGQRADKNGP